MARHDVIVVGAGAIGAAAAWHCARLGERVLLLERGTPASGTSGRGAGVVNRLLWHPLDIALVQRSIHWFRALGGDDGAFRYHDVGGLLLVDAPGMAAARRWLRVWKAQSLEVAELDPDEVAALPGCGAMSLSADTRGYFLDGDGWCVTTDAVNAMLRAAVHAGAEIRTGATVTAVREGEARLEGGSVLTADRVIVAAGAWTPQALAPVWDAPIAAYRPQAAVLSVPHDERMPAVHDVPNHTYWRSEGPGKLLVGDGTVLAPQDVRGTPAVDPTFAADVRDALARRIPAAADAALVRAWGGFEAGTPDRSPIVGEVPGAPGVFVCAGGNGFGFMRSPALGEAVAHAATGKAPPVPVKEFEPSRFAGWDGRPFELREGFSIG